MDNATRTSEKRNSHNFFWKNLNQMEHLPEPRAGVEWTTILKWILGFHKMREISRQDEKLEASQQGL